MPETDGKIDVHHHMVPEFYRDHLQRLGVDQAAGVALSCSYTPTCTPASRIFNWSYPDT